MRERPVTGYCPTPPRCKANGYCDSDKYRCINRPASFTDEDVERVAEAIRGALADTWTIARETTEAPTEAELDAAARAALSAYLEPTTKGDT